MNFVQCIECNANPVKIAQRDSSIPLNDGIWHTIAFHQTSRAEKIRFAWRRKLRRGGGDTGMEFFPKECADNSALMNLRRTEFQEFIANFPAERDARRVYSDAISGRRNRQKAPGIRLEQPVACELLFS